MNVKLHKNYICNICPTIVFLFTQFLILFDNVGVHFNSNKDKETQMISEYILPIALPDSADCKCFFSF